MGCVGLRVLGSVRVLFHLAPLEDRHAAHQQRQRGPLRPLREAAQQKHLSNRAEARLQLHRESGNATTRGSRARRR